jgi:hypothetical protein
MPYAAIVLSMLYSNTVCSSNLVNILSATLSSSPASFINGQRSPPSLPAVSIDATGKVSMIQVRKQELANELELPLRDLRVIDPSFPTQIKSTFVARTTGILFTLENIKVVVKCNEAVIFSPFLPEAQEYIRYLQQQIAQSKSEVTDHQQQSRFELIVIEAALSVVCSSFTRKIRR